MGNYSGQQASGGITGVSPVIGRPTIYDEDFLAFGRNSVSDTNHSAAWRIGGSATVTNTSFNVADGADGGVLRFFTSAVSGEGVFMQLEGSSFACALGRPMHVAYLFGFESVTAVTHWIGMAQENAVVGATTPVGTQPQGFGLRIVDGAVGWETKNASGTTTVQPTSSVIVASIGNLRRIEFVWDGISQLIFLLDGLEIARATANIPVGIRLSPTFGGVTTAAVAKFYQVGRVYAGVAPSRTTF